MINSFVSWEGMLIRGAVAAIDFNHNVNRNEKVTATGAPMCKIRVCMMIAQWYINIPKGKFKKKTNGGKFL